MAEVGVFTLEIIATGMHNNSFVTFREYIQNSFNAIVDTPPHTNAEGLMRSLNSVEVSDFTVCNTRAVDLFAAYIYYAAFR